MDDTIGLDAAVDVLDAYTAAGNGPVRRFLCAREVPPTQPPSWHDDPHLVEHERQEAEILQ